MATSDSPSEEHEVEPGADHGDGEDQLLGGPQPQQPQREAAQQDQVGDVEQQLDRVVKLQPNEVPGIHRIKMDTSPPPVPEKKCKPYQQLVEKKKHVKTRFEHRDSKMGPI